TAHAGHEREEERPLRALVERGACFGVERPAAADAAEPHVGLDHADHLEPAERFHDAIGGVGADGLEPHHADLYAAGAHVGEGVGGGYGGAALAVGTGTV